MKNFFSAAVRRLPAVNRVIAVVAATVLIMLMFPHRQHGTHYDYSIGSFWKANDLYAPYDFQVLEDEADVNREIVMAKSQSTLYYVYDSTAQRVALARLASLRHTMSTTRYHALQRSVDDVYRIGYIEITDEYPDIENHTIVLLEGNMGSEHAASEFVSRSDIDDSLLTDSILVPSICLDVNRTQMELESRLSQLRYSSRSVGMGELIVAKGEYVSEEKGRIIASLEAENDRRFVRQFNPLAHYIGRFMLIAIAFVALMLFLRISHREIYDNFNNILIVLTTIVLMSALMAFVVNFHPAWTLMVPLCIGALLMHVIFDMRAALYIHITTIIILGHMVPDSFEFVFYMLTSGMMAIVTVREFERRSQFFVACLVVFITLSVIYTSGILWQDTSLRGLRPDRFIQFFLNAVLTLMAYPLIYMYEKLFHVTTNLTLMEIANTNTPALRELSRKAPGTFQHAMQVANISEDLINEIGGNALLAKVGGLYHDIGKIANPLYFTENQNSGYNPHGELPYLESARIITQHVRDGIELAHKYRLPSDVVDFIRTHHGTTHTGYFYARYLSEHQGEKVDDTPFRYPGPRPFSRETAVVMIVDSVEAACRSLKEPTKENIGRLVDSIIDSKVGEDQMSQCALTFNDISAIRERLKAKMLSIYHVRVAYPVIS